MSKEEEVNLPIKHVKYDGTERGFKAVVVKAAPEYKLAKPERTFFVQLVRFSPGKGPKDYVDFYKDVDNQLMAKYGKNRCQMDVHEIATFLTLGRYDMVVLWDAPNMETYQRVIAASVNPGTAFGSSETHSAVTAMSHT